LVRIVTDQLPKYFGLITGSGHADTMQGNVRGGAATASRPGAGGLGRILGEAGLSAGRGFGWDTERTQSVTHSLTHSLTHSAH
jgi:hypothetical protein